MDSVFEGAGALRPRSSKSGNSDSGLSDCPNDLRDSLGSGDFSETRQGLAKLKYNKSQDNSYSNLDYGNNQHRLPVLIDGRRSHNSINQEDDGQTSRSYENINLPELENSFHSAVDQLDTQDTQNTQNLSNISN